MAKRAADSAKVDPHLTISRSVCRARPLPRLPLSSEHPIFASIRFQDISSCQFPSTVSGSQQLRAV